MNVIESHGLGKSYGSTKALDDCTLAIPEGHIVALVGPNGAGKSTLLSLAVGLAAPSEGGLTVLDGEAPGSPAALDGIAFVAQDTPLYKNLSAADMLHVTRNLNRRFDQPSARARLAELGIPLKRKAGKLSGGQQAQLALTLALARRPRLLVLDEPVAMLDPISPSRLHGHRAGRGSRRRPVGFAVLPCAGGARADGRLPRRPVRRTGAGGRTRSTTSSPTTACSRVRPARPPRMPTGRWCTSAAAVRRRTCWSERAPTSRCRPAGRRTQWAWRNSPCPISASPMPRRCPGRSAPGTPSRRR